MNSAFDPLNILILAVAVVVLWRLRSVLGTRTGHERRYDPFQTAERTEKQPPIAKTDDKVIPMPGRGTAGEPTRADADEPEEVPVWKGVAPEGSPLAKGLAAIASADPSFDPKEFVEGAKVAYEMIVTAFAEGDRDALRSLLTADVHAGFEDAIGRREKAGEVMESKLVGIDGAEIVAASLNGSRASVTVSFRSQTIQATLDRAGEVVSGDPRRVEEMTDVWTFERDVRSPDPNWALSDTEEPA